MREQFDARQFSVQAAVPRLRLFQLAVPRLRPLQLLLPDCIRFSCCSPITSASAAAPRLRPLPLLLPNRVGLLVEMHDIVGRA